MANAAADDTKRTRLSRPEQAGQLVGVRLQPDQLAALDAYIHACDETVSRPAAIRRLLTSALCEHALTPPGR